MQNSQRKPARRPELGASVLLLPVLAAACGTTDPAVQDDVAWLVRHGRFADAVVLARSELEANPDDPGAQRLHRDAEVAFLLERGRRAAFAGSHEEALEFFRQAEGVDPENPVVADWILKTRRQLASEWLDRAAELTGPDQLHEAELALEKALEYTPDDAVAREALARVLLLENHRAGQSKKYFDDGVRTLRDLFLQQARRNFDVSFDYDRRNDRAKTRGDDVERLIAEQRLAQASSLEEAGLFHAARNEYRLVLLIELGNPAAEEGLARMDRETRVSRWLAEAEMQMRRGESDKARELLAEAEATTTWQTDRVRAMVEQLEESRLRRMYERARTLEKDYLYSEAVAAYDELLELDPEYADADARRRVLEDFILKAETYYAEAEAAASDEEAAAWLEQVRIVWPEYRDVDARLREIEDRLGAESFEE